MTTETKNDIIAALKHIGAMAALFLIIVLVALSEKNLAIILTTTAVGGGAPFIIAALNKAKQVNLKWVAGWATIGLAAGICFAAFGV